MPKYNIYKIDKSKEEDLIEKLESVNLKLSKSLDIGDYNLSFYFSEEPDNISIWWTDLYSDFIDDEDVPFNKAYFATLLISSDEDCYAISLGKSHFYLRQYCDSDFGLDLAERIVDENNLKIKNSRYFASRKNKVIASYAKNSEIEVDSGESMQYIKASTIDNNKWGKTVSFGSSVSFNIDISPLDLPELIKNVKEALTEEPKISLPREQKVKDEEKIKELDKELVNAILSENEIATLNSQQMSVCGVDFIFSDSFRYELYLKGKRKKFSIDGDITISKLKQFISQEGIDLQIQINDIKVKVHSETSSTHTKDIKYFLDYVNNDRYCLLNGEWYKFNQSYITYLNENVDSIELNTDEENNFYKSKHEEYLTLNGYNKQTMYAEKYFNIEKEGNGYINIDRSLSRLGNSNYKVEIADLYKDNTLYFVKIGTPQKLGYVIDQAMNSLKLMQNKEINNEHLELDNNVIMEPKSLCLWIILERAGTIEKLSQLNSIIFLMKLTEWKKECINAGYKPIVKIGYMNK